MLSNSWPPEIDAIKINQTCLLGRVKNTDIWIEIDLADPIWEELLVSHHLFSILR